MEVNKKNEKKVCRFENFCIFAAEIWQSGRSRRSWKPLYRNVSGVRIPLSPLGSNSQMGCFLFEDRLGEMPEWSNGAVSKTVERYAFQGFESLSLRIFWFYGVNILSRFRGGFFFFAAPAYFELGLIFIWSILSLEIVEKKYCWEDYHWYAKIVLLMV